MPDSTCIGCSNLNIHKLEVAHEIGTTAEVKFGAASVDIGLLM